MNGTRVLRRSRRHRILGGVVGGAAEYIGLDPTLARVLYILVSIVSYAFPGTLVYIICWFIIPEE